MRQPRVCSRNSLCLRCLRGLAAVLCNDFALKNHQKTAPKRHFLHCKLPRLGLQNVSFRILKRHVSHCDMCRFAFRRGFGGIPIWRFCLSVSYFVAFCRVKFRREFKSFLHFKWCRLGVRRCVALDAAWCYFVGCERHCELSGDCRQCHNRTFSLAGCTRFYVFFLYLL